MLIPLIQGIHGLIPLGIQFIEKLIAQVLQPLLLAEPTLLLPVKRGVLPDQENNQHRQTGQKQ